MKPVNKHPKHNPGYSNSVFVSPAGNDAFAVRNDPARTCLTLQRAVEIGLPGDTIIVSAGTYELREYLDVPDAVSLKGIGLPVINSFVNLVDDGCSIVPGDRTVIDGFQINAASTARIFTALIGSRGQKGFTDAVVKNCSFNGTSDVFFFYSGTVFKGITIQQCVLKSQWDAFVSLDLQLKATIIDCDFTLNGPSPLSDVEPCRAIVARGEVNVRNCRIKVAGPYSGNRGVLCSPFSAGSTVSVCGTTFDVTGPDAKDIEVDQTTSQLIGPTPTCA